MDDLHRHQSWLLVVLQEFKVPVFEIREKNQVHDRARANHRHALAQQNRARNLELFITNAANVIFIIAIYQLEKCCVFLLSYACDKLN